MGQYFRLINYDKEEYIDTWKLGGFAKLWEWCANNYCRLLPFLLRQSSERGGGDIQKDCQYAGRWANDKIALVGDYDESRDFERVAVEFKDISLEAAAEYNDFIGEAGFKLKLTPKTL